MPLVNKIYLFVLLINALLVIYFVFIKKLFREMPFLAYCLLVCGIEFLLNLDIIAQKYNPLAYSVYLTFTCILFFLTYYQNLNSRYLKKISVYVNGLFFLVMYFTLYQSISRGIFPIRSFLVFSLFNVFNALFIYLDLILQPVEMNIGYSFRYWFSTATMIWSVFFVFRIGASDYLSEHAPFFLKNLDVAFRYILILIYSIYTFGILCLLRTRQLYSHT